MRQAIGVAVLGGMLGVTVFGIFLTPVFFAVVDRLKHGPVFSHPRVLAAGTLGLYLLKMRFVRPALAFIKDAAEAGMRRLRGRKPTNPT
jgi:multidrug efflux pump